MKVSIVITAYNVEQWIRQSVMSALHQKHIQPPKEGDNPEWYDFTLEVIVINDCSTDSTASVLNGLAAEHKAPVLSGSSAEHKAPVLSGSSAEHNLTIITNASNQGAGMSRRIGIQHATGDYILLLDGDDYLQPTFIASLVYSAQKYNADIVSGGITILRDEKVGYFDQTCYGNFIACGANKVTNFYRERIVFMNNKLIRRSLHDQVPYCERRYIEDTPVIAKQLYLANKVVYTNNPGYVYRMQSQSLTHSASELKGNIFKALCMMDLVEFYRDKGEPYTELFNISQFFILYNTLKASGASPEQLEPYRHEVLTLNAYAEAHLAEYNSSRQSSDGSQTPNINNNETQD